ncbi:MAG: hypothetical protein OHK0015_51570 [Chloroflexi bacterium OHK40]
MPDDQRLAALRAAITARGWRIRPGKAIPYGEQLIVDDGTQEATLDFYPRRGRTVVGGAEGPLRRSLTELATATEQRFGGVAAPPPSRDPRPAPPQAPEIGMDESGKGDWFGPLVVAAVYLEPAAATALLAAGVRDSKELGASALAATAASVARILPAGAIEITVLDPADYNRRYAELGNINLLLAELYASTAARLVARTGAAPVVCDQFAQRAERLNTAFARVGLPHPRQLHHAEAVSLAVATASVLASARFQEELARLGHAAGLGEPLPKGASAIGALRRAARQIIAREGPTGLGAYAKLNFKPVQELLSGG